MKQRILLIAAGLCGLAMSSQAALVAYYKFDEAEGATTAANSVPGSSTAAISVGVTTGQAGIQGNAYLFNNAAGVVDAGNASFLPNLTNAQKVTIAAWVRTSDLTGGRNVVVFAGNDAVSDRYLDLGYSGVGDPNAGPANNLAAGKGYVRDRLSGNGINAYSNTAPSVNDGSWHQLVMTIDVAAASNQLSLYVDGSLANSQTLVSPFLGLPVLNNFEIGRLGRSAPTDYYGGLIDDVQVYDTVLSASEVSFLFANPGTAIPEPGALALGALGLLSFAYRRRA